MIVRFCLLVCSFVCLLETLQKNYWSDSNLIYHKNDLILKNNPNQMNPAILQGFIIVVLISSSNMLSLERGTNSLSALVLPVSAAFTFAISLILHMPSWQTTDFVNFPVWKAFLIDSSFIFGIYLKFFYVIY